MLNMRAKAGILPCIFFAVAHLATASAATERVSMPAVYKSVREEFGSDRGSYFVPDKPVSEQIIMGLGIPNPTVQLADGNYLVSGCRPHSCDEKAAVIVKPTGMILMAGLINFHCRRDVAKKSPTSAGAVICERNPRLTVLVTRKNNQPVLVQELRDWAVRKSQIRVTETQVLR